MKLSRIVVSALTLVVLAAGLVLATPAELAAPHCCSSGASGACRDLCKQQGPGCKGTIGCRAGECVCTCSCP